MIFSNSSLPEFTELLASSDPVPGGGGASALVACVGIALGDMVGELTVGKKKYADVENEVRGLMEKAQSLRKNLLVLIDADAEAFAPLARAYSIPKDDPSRAEIMEAALKTAAGAPMEILRACAKALDLIRGFAEMGSRLAISDAGCGALFCKAAMEAAALNVFINTKLMQDREYARSLEQEADALLQKYRREADDIYELVSGMIRP